MNTVTLLGLATAVTALALCPAHAQFVKGNEAVRMTATGKVVTTPPVPASMGQVCRADASCHAGAWRMVETKDGLMECTDPFARPGACRTSTYGSQKLRRVWVVLRKDEWVQCQYPELGSKCKPLFARPPANMAPDAIQ
ncbi:hypothetical protein CKO44_00295 [Rubrivivax gelatinosus]|uniref:Secreted protein n=1 Tax=Rubrivivax gelatinosus TaxID=28068 RepID=A0ABS1DPB1_RUBGE|nr:hypothetical protein [Rubrivivax gelatinosus]MBK1611909.1 hypothetical protein [Rubrivivax gelatinosus]MBK1711566.1 hypothetical protein [Rubrivivax gelatinosus]